jgi:DNA invertase Pin-like site-specific DNA recombinase
MLSKKSRRGGGVLVGYASTSTVDQNADYEAQQRDLKAAGCTKIFAEQTSSVAQREQLNAAIDYLREGDRKLVRLARSMRERKIKRQPTVYRPA